MRIEPSELRSPGILLELVVHRLFGEPVDLRRRQLVVLRIEDADLVLGEIIRLGLHLRDQVLAHDRDRHGPVRIEVDLDDARIDVGRRPVRLADHRDVARHHGAVLDRLELRGRDVADDETGGLLGVERAQPRQIGFQLAQPLVGRDVERVEGERAGPPVGRKPVARLEAPHRGLDVGIVDVVLDRGRIEIARKLQPLAQRDDAPDCARRCAGGRSPAPAASRRSPPPARSARSPARCAARFPARASAARPSACGWCARRSRTPRRGRRAGSAGSAAAAGRRPAPAPRSRRRSPRGRRARCGGAIPFRSVWSRAMSRF